MKGEARARFLGGILGLLPVLSCPAGAAPSSPAVDPEARRRWIDEADPLDRLARTELRNVYRDLPRAKFQNSSIFRVDLPLIGGFRMDLPYVVTDTRGERESGLGDLLMQRLYVLGERERLTWGGGLLLVFPTASLDSTGRGRYLAAPALGGLWKFRGGLATLIVQDYFSFGQNRGRADVHELFLQPSLTMRFRQRWWVLFVSGSYLDWKNGNRWFIPAAAELGRALNPHWTLSARAGFPVVDDQRRYDSEVTLRLSYYYLRQANP